MEPFGRYFPLKIKHVRPFCSFISSNYIKEEKNGRRYQSESIDISHPFLVHEDSKMPIQHFLSCPHSTVSKSRSQGLPQWCIAQLRKVHCFVGASSFSANFMMNQPGEFETTRACGDIPCMMACTVIVVDDLSTCTYTSDSSRSTSACTRTCSLFTFEKSKSSKIRQCRRILVTTLQKKCMTMAQKLFRTKGFII